MERLHAKMRLDAVCAYNFTRGLQLTPKGVLFAHHPSNPFLSLGEQAGIQIQTILVADHDHIKRRWNLKQIGGAPAWLQVIHRDNLSNAAGGLPFGSWWAKRLFVLPTKPQSYALLPFFHDLRPLQVLRKRLFRRLDTVGRSHKR